MIRLQDCSDYDTLGLLVGGWGGLRWGGLA
jgi:hypothetical protein